MIDVVVVSVKELNNIYYLSPKSLELKKGDLVVIETENGLAVGTVCRETYKEKSKNLVLPLSKVIRKATKEDLENCEKNKKKADKALEYAKKLNNDLKLEMNFIEGFYSLDNSQLILFFLAEDRVDFREIAKKLAAKYKTRIELRQVGVRDKSKKVGGLGPCGLFLCCNTFLNDFSSVSINMAKNQMLALNPSKINGMCGRLLCCLGYENDMYTELKKDLPKVGLMADTPMGMGKVVSVNVFRKSYSVDLKEKGIVEFYQDSKK